MNIFIKAILYKTLSACMLCVFVHGTSVPWYVHGMSRLSTVPPTSSLHGIVVGGECVSATLRLQSLTHKYMFNELTEKLKKILWQCELIEHDLIYFISIFIILTNAINFFSPLLKL